VSEKLINMGFVGWGCCIKTEWVSKRFLVRRNGGEKDSSKIYMRKKGDRDA